MLTLRPAFPSDPVTTTVIDDAAGQMIYDPVVAGQDPSGTEWQTSSSCADGQSLAARPWLTMFSLSVASGAFNATFQ